MGDQPMTLEEAVADELLRLRARFAQAMTDVVAERARQVGKGFDAAHDDSNTNDALARGAIAKLYAAVGQDVIARRVWPFSDTREPFDGGERQLLVEAAAMIVAEIERRDRLATLAQRREGVTEAMANTLHAAASDLRFVANGGVCERDTLLAHAHELLALAASGDSALGARDGGAA